MSPVGLAGPVNFRDRYGPLDRVLYRVAFRVGLAQRTMAELEEFLYADTLRSVRLEHPVFITALPRSGTTILLKLLVDTARFASHTYRDMPFLLCPMLWQRFSNQFAVENKPRERAHGDGLQVSADSPEAFEEMIWKHFWPGHYGDDRIRLWTNSDRNPEFEEFLETHMKKVVALRREGPEDDRRYVSKNNLNIARLQARPGPLRGGSFLVPFREPVQHAASMLNQHRRFLELHERDGFVREYMEAIGHHEFGEGLKPVDLGGWLEEAQDPTELEFWLRYWIAAYGHVLEQADDGMVLVSYARLTGEPEVALARLAAAIDVPASVLVGRAGRLRAPRTHEVDASRVPGSVLEEASGLFKELRERAPV